MAAEITGHLPPLATPRGCGLEASTASLEHQVALELTERPEKVEDERPPAFVVSMASVH